MKLRNESATERLAREKMEREKTESEYEVAD